MHDDTSKRVRGGRINRDAGDGRRWCKSGKYKRNEKERMKKKK